MRRHCVSLSRDEAGAASQKVVPGVAPPPEAGVLFVHDPHLEQYNLGPEHPLRPRRHVLLVDLLEATGVLQLASPEVLIPSEASREDLLLVHSAPYVEAVERLSASG